MIRSILSWSVVLNAEVKSTINAYVSCLKFLASSWVVMKFWSCLSLWETAARQTDLWHDHYYNRLPAMRLRSLWYPYPSLHFLSLFSLQVGKVSAACSCCRTYTHCTRTGRTGRTGLGVATPVAPQGLEGSTPWRTCYKVVRSKQGITVSSSLTCSTTALPELTMGSSTPPTDLTNLWVIMQYKSGTA